MAHSFKLVAVLLAAFSASAHAGYAQLAPPSGFGGSPGNWTFAPSANDVRYGATAHSPNALRVPVPGTSATMPASYRFAANAPRIAAAAIFSHPYVRVGLGIASWLGVAGIVWDVADNMWKQKVEGIECLSDCFEYKGQFTGLWYKTLQEAGAASMGKPAGCSGYSIYPAQLVSVQAPDIVRFKYAYCGNGQVFNDVSTTNVMRRQIPPFNTAKFEPIQSEQQFKDLLSSPMPENVPWELPPKTPLPVDLPVINPEPVPNPQPRPLFVPTGDPVPNPQYDPNTAPGPNNQPWIQPGTKVTPSPTPSEPWRVDIQPVNRPVPGPEPMPGPEPYPPPNPNPDPNNPNPDPNSPEKPNPEEQQSLCEKHPDILACEKLKLGDAGEAKDVPDEKKELAINKDPGWGQENGTCPAPRTVQIQGFSLEMPFTLLCDFASGIRPVVIGLAWLAAAFTFMGIGRRS